MEKFQVPLENRPAKRLSFLAFNPTTNEKEEMVGINCCYHIAHGKQWEALFKLMENQPNGDFGDAICRQVVHDEENNSSIGN